MPPQSIFPFRLNVRLLTRGKDLANCMKCGIELMPTFKRCPSCGHLQSEAIADRDPPVGSTPETQNKPIGAVKSDPKSSGTDEWVDGPPTPWRRYGARALDTTFNGFLGIQCLAIIFYAIAPYNAEQFFTFFASGIGLLADYMFTAFIATIVSGALIGICGMSLGKWIFGIKVLKTDGNNIGLFKGIERDINVLIRGMGLAIPVISLVPLWMGYQKLTKTGMTTWDSGQYIVWHRPSSSIQTVLNIIGIILIIVCATLIRILGKL
jgi:uncharacterized RDD family membrane protein YckC